MTSLDQTFNRIKSSKAKAFIPYIMAGDPDLESTLNRIELLQQCGADILELGVPFSDPLADGPTIQSASMRALSKGVTLRKILPFLRQHRKEINIPVVLMSYYNPIFKYGEEDFLRDAQEAGVAGVIVPDLTAEEGAEFAKRAKQYDLDTIFLVAPTSTKGRIEKILSLCSGFVYYVSITGITGSQLKLPEHFTEHLSLIRSMSSLPIAVGFGISTPEEAGLISRWADGIIVGSAIVKAFQQDISSAKTYIKSLREAIGNQQDGVV